MSSLPELLGDESSSDSWLDQTFLQQHQPAVGQQQNAVASAEVVYSSGSEGAGMVLTQPDPPPFPDSDSSSYDSGCGGKSSYHDKSSSSSEEEEEETGELEGGKEKEGEVDSDEETMHLPDVS